MAVAVSILVVGVVWASSGALQTTDLNPSVVSTTIAQEDENQEDPNDGDLPGIDPGDEIDELRRQVVDLTDKVDALTKIVDTTQSDIAAVEAVANKAATAADRVKSIADGAATDAAEALRVVGEVSTRFGVLELRTSKLNDEGIYSGSINPSQFSRRLATADVNGNWPLDRVTGELETKFLLLPFTGNCSTRYGFYSVLVSDAFRRLSCERIANQ